MSLRIEAVNHTNTIKELYYRSFPKEERVPLWYLFWKAKKDFVDFYAFYDKHDFVGFTYIIHEQDIAFVMFFAINDRLRSRGYGSKVLAKLREQYPNNRIILEIELLDESAANYEQRVKRKNFYLRNGFRNASFNIMDEKVSYEVLVNGKGITAEEFRILYRKFTGTLIYLFGRPKLYTAGLKNPVKI